MSHPIQDHAFAYGGDTVDLTVVGRRGFLVLPRDKARITPLPWVWYAPVFVAHPRNGNYPTHRHDWLFGELLANDIAIAGLDVGESYGNTEGRQLFSAFHNEVVQRHNLDPRPVLLAQSRGALMLYNWASENPRLCRGIAGIYPVMDLNTWPPDIACASAAYGLEAPEFRRRLAEFNPIDRLTPLAQAHVPIMHIHGDKDDPVPLGPNSGELIKRYQALGGSATLITVQGKGHEEVDEFFMSETFRDFIIQYSTGA